MSFPLHANPLFLFSSVEILTIELGATHMSPFGHNDISKGLFPKYGHFLIYWDRSLTKVSQDAIKQFIP